MHYHPTLVLCLLISSHTFPQFIPLKSSTLESQFNTGYISWFAKIHFYKHATIKSWQSLISKILLFESSFFKFIGWKCCLHTVLNDLCLTPTTKRWGSSCAIHMTSQTIRRFANGNFYHCSDVAEGWNQARQKVLLYWSCGPSHHSLIYCQKPILHWLSSSTLHLIWFDLIWILN